jgi:hypothetical protein
MGLGGDDFAGRMRSTASGLGLPDVYDKVKVSKIETGVRDLSLEDVAVLEAMDPRKRGWHWVAFGVQQRGAKLSGGVPAPRPGEEKGRKRA